ncbi:MAG: glycine cleavage system protein T [Oscillospiraceae bacterium]|nr:glycine cleavage system protein T [Oscillospiraceae bacterium]
MLKRTPLFEAHKRLGANMVDFGGWEMPLQYASIIEEHLATREKAGLFDVSHMGEITVKGKSAKPALDRLVTCNLNAIPPGKIVYTFLTNEKGGVVDDLLIYVVSDVEFLLVVNASNTDKDFDWVLRNIAGSAGGGVGGSTGGGAAGSAGGGVVGSTGGGVGGSTGDGVEVENLSYDYSQLAIQGPLAQAILQKLTDFDLEKIRPFTFDRVKLLRGSEAIVSRTGYTGEDGFEIYCNRTEAEEIWNSLLSVGEGEGIKPVGLGARDTLRFESSLPLYGHELTDEITPIEAGLKRFVKLGKDDYIGKEILEIQARDGTERRLVGVELTERGIPRCGFRIEKDGADIGYITSGVYSPTFKKGLAMALISSHAAQPDTDVSVIIRDKSVGAKVVKLPFYRRKP